MPAKIRVPEYKESDIRVEVEAQDDRAVPPNTVILYEHKKFKTNGRVRRINVTQHSATSLYSLHAINFKDCLSSLKWNLDDGIVVTLYEDHDGGGRQYQIWGKGKDSDTHNNNFGDCASSWNWYRSS